MNKKVQSFRKGQVVQSGHNAILVTGPGDKSLCYPTFSGVVIMAVNREEEACWPTGMYSDAWTAECFKKTGLKLSEVVKKALENQP